MGDVEGFPWTTADFAVYYHPPSHKFCFQLKCRSSVLHTYVLVAGLNHEKKNHNLIYSKSAKSLSHKEYLHTHGQILNASHFCKSSCLKKTRFKMLMHSTGVKPSMHNVSQPKGSFQNLDPKADLNIQRHSSSCLPTGRIPPQ